MKYTHVNFEDAYTLTENGYLMEAERDLATLLCLSNGYMGVRGSLEECGILSVQGSYVRGVIETCHCAPVPVVENGYMKSFFDEDAVRRIQMNDAFVNVADFLRLRFIVNGETFCPWEGKLIEWKRSLDMRNNKLVRQVVWENSKGEKTSFWFERFASYADDHLFAIRVCVTPENYNGTIEIQSGIDTLTKTIGGDGGGYLLGLDKEYCTKGNRCFYTYVTGEKYQIPVAVGTETTAYDAEEQQIGAWVKAEEADVVVVHNSIAVQAGRSYTVEKMVYVVTGRDTDRKPGELVVKKLDAVHRYEVEEKLHIDAWKSAFGKIDIEIDGDYKADAALRFSNYQTLGSFNRNDAVHSLGAKGLTGPIYGGLVWWDCDVYQSPVFYMTMAEQAKNLLLYRYDRLEAAKQNAAKEGCKGAKYPFNSGVTGDEVVWPLFKHPYIQIHVVAGVAWSICNYYNCSGDDEFMVSYGMEMLYEICKYWLSRVEKDERGYVINRVTGTDEHHHFVDNNAYTNYLVRYIAKRTLEFTKQYQGRIDEVRSKTEMSDDMLANLQDLVDNMYLPMERGGMIPQFDGYFELSRDLEIVGASGGGSVAAMKASGLYHKSQVIKQPDVLVMFAYQNFEFQELVYKRNWDYYRARCESTSSLSYSVHSICASDMDEPESAYTYFMQTAMMELDDEHHTVYQGVHSACAAGAWLAVVRGIGGTILRADKVEINPHMIPWWDEVRYSVKWHGQTLLICLNNDEIRVESAKDNDKDTPLVLRGEEIWLKPGQIVTRTLSL